MTETDTVWSVIGPWLPWAAGGLAIVSVLASLLPALVRWIKARRR